MAAGQASKILKSPARLVVNPTDLSAAYPFGGVEVGRANLVVLTMLGVQVRIESEPLGEATDILEAANQTSFGCFLRGWDDDAVQQFLGHGYQLGAVTGHAVFSSPGSAHPGQSAFSRAVKLLVYADNPIDSPSCLIHRGIPDWTEAAELAWSRSDEMGIPLTIECLRGSVGRIVDVGRFADLSLS